MQTMRRLLPVAGPRASGRRRGPGHSRLSGHVRACLHRPLHRAGSQPRGPEPCRGGGWRVRLSRRQFVQDTAGKAAAVPGLSLALEGESGRAIASVPALGLAQASPGRARLRRAVPLVGLPLVAASLCDAQDSGPRCSRVAVRRARRLEFGSKKAAAISVRLPASRACAYKSMALRAERGHSGQACLAFLNPLPAETKFDPHPPSLTRVSTARCP